MYRKTAIHPVIYVTDRHDSSTRVRTYQRDSNDSPKTKLFLKTITRDSNAATNFATRRVKEFIKLHFKRI